MKHDNTYYAVYDVAADDTRQAIIRILKDGGLVRIQKSVFCGRMSAQLKKDILENIKQVIDKETDSFFLVMNCHDCFKKFISMGQDPNFTYVDETNRGLVF